MKLERSPIGLKWGDVVMNLNQYIEKLEAGQGGLEEFKLKGSNDLNRRIWRLYIAYGEAKKTGFYGQDSLSWILSSLGEALTKAGLTKAYALLKKDIDASFTCFWTSLDECGLSDSHSSQVKVMYHLSMT